MGCSYKYLYPVKSAAAEDEPNSLPVPVLAMNQSPETENAIVVLSASSAWAAMDSGDQNDAISGAVDGVVAIAEFA